MKAWIAGWMAVGLLLLGSVSARAGDQDFVLVNKTGVEIHKVFISASETDEWEEDVLGEDTLPDGAKVKITFSPDEEAELWDIKVEDGEGTSIVWTGLNLLKISKVTLHFDDGEATADLE